jgi:hypothetical protein
MLGDGCRAELYEEKHHDALKAACAEDGEVWEIYANNFGPDGFDKSIDRYTSNPNNRTFVLFERDELAGIRAISASTRAARCWRSAAPTTARTCAARASIAASRT